MRCSSQDCEADSSPLQTLGRVARAWSRSRLVQSTYEHLLSHYPSKIHLDSSTQQVVLEACVLLPQKRAKVILRARCGGETLLSNDALLKPGMLQVERVYGNVDATALTDKIAQLLPRYQNAGGLSRACSEAVASLEA